LAIWSAAWAQTVRPKFSSPALGTTAARICNDERERWQPAVDFETFSKILNRPGGFREPFDIEEYIRGFQVFDKDRSGFVGKGQIKYILTNLGEKMSEEEVDELFKSTIDASNNEVDYRGKLYAVHAAAVHRVSGHG
jgi:Ca2+-binding EF-hand superfamily protein